MQVGLPICSTQLMYINTETCFFPHLDNLFTIADITAEVDRLLPEVPSRINQFRMILAETVEPTLAIGKHCDKPNRCTFWEDCWKHVPEVSIFSIPRLDWKKKEGLIAQGILAIAELPTDYQLSDNQRSYVSSVLANQPQIGREAIAASLAELEYPIQFFDFEAQNPAIPWFHELKPYEQFPLSIYQYSCQVLQADGSIQHHEYLHTDQSDPRPKLIAALTTDISPDRLGCHVPQIL